MPSASNRLLNSAVVDLLEDVLEAPVVGFQNRVLGREVDGILAHQPVVQRGAGEIANRVVEVVHRHRNAPAGKFEHLSLDHLAVLAFEADGQTALPGDYEIGRAVLIAIGVAADDNRLRPTGDETRHVLADDRLAEDDAAQNVADRAVRAPPHLLEMELFDPRLVGRDRRAFHADAAGLDRLGCVDRHLVVGRVAMLDRKVEIVELDVQIGMNELVADEAPDDACHLVAVELDNRILNLDLGHRREFPQAEKRGATMPSPYSIGSLSGKAHPPAPVAHAEATDVENAAEPRA